MGRPRNPGPDEAELRRWLAEGLTHEQMAERATEQYSWPWTANGIAVRISRAGLSEQRGRHEYTVPWRVRDEHSRAYQVNMLRLLARRIGGEALTDKQGKQLDAFLRGLERDDAVIGYSDTKGWVRISRGSVPRQYLHPDERVPIIPPEAKMVELAKRQQAELDARTEKSGRRLAALRAGEGQRAG